MANPLNSVLERKESEKERRRKDILRFAQAVFVKLGYHEATIEKIAQEAALGKGTVYYYYDNKEAILADLMIEIIDGAKREVFSQLRHYTGFRPTIGFLAAYGFDFLTANLPLWHVVQREHGRFAEKCPQNFLKLKKSAGRLQRLAVRLLRRLLKFEGRREDAEIIFDLISCQVIGYAHQHFAMKKDRAALHEKLQRSLDMVWRGIAQGPGVSS